MEEIRNDDTVKNEPVPYWTYEEDMARAERHTKRWMIAFFVCFTVFVISVLGFVFYESQFEDVVSTQTITQDSGEGGQNTFSGDFYGGGYDGEADNNKVN